MAPHAPHLLIDLREEARRDKGLHHAVALTIREREQVSSVHALHNPVNLEHLVSERGPHLLADYTGILRVEDQVEKAHDQTSIDEQVHDEARDADHLVQHWDHVSLEGHGLDLALVHSAHEEPEERLALQQTVAVVQVRHVLGLLRRAENFAFAVEHHGCALLPWLQRRHQIRALPLTQPVGPTLSI